MISQSGRSEEHPTFFSEYIWEISAAILLLPMLGGAAVWLLVRDGYVAAVFLILVGLAVLAILTFRSWRIDLSGSAGLSSASADYAAGVGITWRTSLP